jgi:thymidylate kinase
LTIAVLGPDGSGKSTLLAELAGRGAGPIPVRSWYLGLYGASGGRVRAGAAGRLGRAWRRWAAGRLHAARGGVAVFDRYTYDARLATGPAGLRDRLRRGLLARALPAPDLTIVLDAPADLLHRRKAEQSEAVLEAQRARYRALAGSLPGAELVDASADAETVRRAVTARIWRRLAARAAGR